MMEETMQKAEAAIVLEVKNLGVRFAQTAARQGLQGTDSPAAIAAVDGLSLRVERGKTLGIVGESGSGKSVSCLAAMQLIPPAPIAQASGEIWFQGHGMAAPVNLLGLSDRQMQRYRGSQMGMIFQEPMSALNPVYSCGAQIVETLLQHETLSPLAAEQRAIALLQEVQLLPSEEELAQRFAGQGREAIPRYCRHILNKYPHEFSGGQIQRIMLAMAIACNPSLLIADEPTTALDVTVQATILQLLRQLQTQRQMAMIFVSHDLGVIAEVADDVAVMYQGKLVEYGAIADVFRSPQHPYTQGLLACRPRLNQTLGRLPTVADFMSLEVSPTGEPILQARQPDWSQFAREPGVGGEHSPDLSSGHSSGQTPTPEPLLRVEQLRVEYASGGRWGGLGLKQGGIVAVDDVSFEIGAGETLGLVGESGCGKSTLARAILRLTPAQAGQVWFEGQDILRLRDKALRRVRRNMQIIFQDPYSALDPRFCIEDALLEPMLIHAYDKGQSAHRDRVIYWLERVGLDRSALRRYPHEFSGGQRQRICIARALTLNPRLIVCDESVSALDVSVQAQVLNLLRELQRELGLTYLFISHDLSVVKFMSDRVVVMNRGRIEEIGTPDQIYNAPQREYTKRLLNAIPTAILEYI